LKAALAVALLCLTAAHAFAEDDRAERTLRAGATSIEAGASTLFGGATGEIAVRRHLSPAWAVRAGVQLSGTHRRGENGNLFDTGAVVTQLNSENFDVDFSLLAMAYPLRSGNVALALGAGPVLSRTRSERHEDTRYPDGTTARRLRDGEDSHRSLGAALDAGFEWFFDRRLALRAHSQARFEWTHDRQSNFEQEIDFAGNVDSRNGYGEETHGTRFSTQTFGVALVGYF
jgi:hypothetical protein